MASSWECNDSVKVIASTLAVASHASPASLSAAAVRYDRGAMDDPGVRGVT